MSGDSGLGDCSMLDLFRAEVETHVPVLSEGLLALEKDPTQTKRLESLMRAAHSIKGAARIVGVDAAVRAAHALEDYFVAAQGGQVRLTSDAIDRLLRGVDMLAQIGQNADAQLANWLLGQQEAVGVLVDDLTALRRGEQAAKPSPERNDTPPSVPVPKVEGPHTVQPSGDLDAAGAEELRRLLLDLLAKGIQHFRLDLSRVRAVEPAGLAVLAVFARAVQERGASVKLDVAEAGADLHQLFRLTRLDRSYHLPARAAAGGG